MRISNLHPADNTASALHQLVHIKALAYAADQLIGWHIVFIIVFIWDWL
jgi:hypothetical protein